MDFWRDETDVSESREEMSKLRLAGSREWVSSVATLRMCQILLMKSNL